MKAVKSLLIFTILVTLILTAIACEDSTKASPEPTQNQDQGQVQTNVSELLDDPQYDATVTIEGEVTVLGELFCSCFILVSGGETVQVWYDTMTGDDGTQLPAVDMQDVENGDWVKVTGQLKQAGQNASLNDFWATGITKSEKPVITDNPDAAIVGGTPDSAGYSWDAERGGWHRIWDPESFIPADQKPEWDRFIPDKDSDTGSDSDLPQMGTATVINVSCDEFQKLDAPAVINKEMEMNVGDTVTIVLCSNPTTGFEWQEIEMSDSTVLDSVERSFAASTQADVVGAPGTETIVLKALDEGMGTMTIAYSRPWNGGEKGIWTFTLAVTVVDAPVVDSEPAPDTDVSTIPAIADLVNREWVLVSFGDPDNPEVVLDDTQVTISFSKEENVSGIGFKGSAGCNSYFGSFEITKEGIAVGPIGATEMYCMDEGVMEQEGQFLSAMGSANGYEVSGDTLEVLYDDGVLIFIAE